MEEPIEEPSVTEPTIGPHFPPTQVPFPSITSTDPTYRVRLACIALANAAEPRNEDWPSNVVSTLPGLTLYSINDALHLIFNGIHAPAHCEYCGRMGDWLCYCRCGRGLHTMSDDGYYSEGQLDIHFDSDVDTAEFLETDHETDDDSTNEGDSVVSVNENNSSTTCYSQSLSSSHYFIWCFLLSLILTSKAFLTSCYSIGQSSLHSFWSYTSFWFLLFAVLFWDTLYLYFDPKAPQGPYQPRSVRRKLTKQKHLPLRSYTKSWLLLSFYMLFVSSTISPFASLSSPISHTYSRLVTLHDLLDFTPLTHLHFSSYCYDDLLSLITPIQLEGPLTPTMP